MGQDTIPKADVSKTDEQDVQQINPRNDEANALADLYAQRMAAERGGGAPSQTTINDPGRAAAHIADDLPPDDQGIGKPTPPAPKPDKQTEIMPPDDFIELNVMGETVKRTRDEVLDAGKRALQKESAADKRLQEASERLKEVERRERELAAKNQPSLDVDQLARQITSLDEAEAKQAIEGLLEYQGRNQATHQQQTIDPAYIAEQVRFENALDEFKQGEYGVFWENPVYNAQICQKFDAARDGGDNRSHKDLLTACAEEIKAEVLSIGKRFTQTNGELNQRKEALANMPDSVDSANVIGSAATAPKPETRNDILDGMRKARGQFI